MLTTSANPYKIYRQTAVETASPAKLLIMLYDGAIKFIYEAKLALERKDYEAANRAMLKVQDILSELMVTLDMNQGEIAQNLYRLYDFYLHEVIVANIEKNVERLQPVAEFLAMFRDVWMEASRKASQEQEMRESI